MDRIPCVIIGGGVVGLAVARAMCLAGVTSIVLERHHRIGLENSSHNSEVVHSGIYYPIGSLKSRLCLQGKQMLLDYMKHKGIAHLMCGKIIVATAADEVSTLHSIYENGIQCGLKDLKILTQEDIHYMEPSVHAVKGIHSPSTSICDSYGVMSGYMQDIEDHESNIVCNCHVHEVHLTRPSSSSDSGGIGNDGMFEVHTSQGSILCDMLVNAAGLYAQKVSSTMSFYPQHTIPGCYYAKGTYYKLQGLKDDISLSSTNPTSTDPSSSGYTSSSSPSPPSSSLLLSQATHRMQQPFSRLVYPIPAVGGLGIHATIDLSGEVKFGPDVEWMPSPSNTDKNHVHATSDTTSKEIYRFPVSSSPYNTFTVTDGGEDHDYRRRQMFYEQVGRYWPAVRDYVLVADYAGIRPKLAPPSHDSYHHHHTITASTSAATDATCPSITTTTTTTATTSIDNINHNSNYNVPSTSDFNICNSSHHGIPNLVCLYGIESPGLTSSLAIGNYVRDILLEEKKTWR